MVLRWKRSIDRRGNCFRVTQRDVDPQHSRSYRFQADGILPLDLDPRCTPQFPSCSFSHLAMPGDPPLHPPALVVGAVPHLHNITREARKTYETLATTGRGAAGKSAHFPSCPQLPLRVLASLRLACHFHNLCCRRRQRADDSSGVPSPIVGLIMPEQFMYMAGHWRAKFNIRRSLSTGVRRRGEKHPWPRGWRI